MHQTSKYSNQSDWKNASKTRDPSFGLTQFTTYERFSLFWSHYRNAITRIKVVACRIQLLKTIPHFWHDWKQCAYVRFCKLDSWSNNDVDNDIFNFSLDRPRPVITRDFGKVREHSQSVWIGRFWGGFPKITITHAICIVKLFKKGPDRHKKISKTCSTHGLWMPPWVRCATLITPQNIFWLKIVNTRMSREKERLAWCIIF